MSTENKFLREEATEIFEETFNRLSVETYEDASEVCELLKKFAIVCANQEEDCGVDDEYNPLDETAVASLKYVADILGIAAKMFRCSDNYLRMFEKF